MFSTMRCALFYTRICVTDAFLDLMFISTNDIICFPFHLSCQDTHGSAQSLMWGLVPLGFLGTDTPLLRFKKSLIIYILTCMFSQIL